MTKKISAIIFTFLTIILLLVWPKSVYAQCVLTFPGGSASIPWGSDLKICSLGNPGRFISAFLPAVLGILGFITVIFIVISGIQFVLSSGNPEAAAGARNRLIYALVGFALIVLAFAITQIINMLFLGTNVV